MHKKPNILKKNYLFAITIYFIIYEHLKLCSQLPLNILFGFLYSESLTLFEQI